MNGKTNTYWIKATLGITALFFLRVHIDRKVWDLDVDLSLRIGEAANKRMTVRHLRTYMNWVQNVARQFGFYLPDNI